MTTPSSANRGHSPEAVANRFLELAREAGLELTPMQLQKLVYIAHGWSLAITGDRLVAEEPKAWRWGPVYPSLYHATKRYGSGPVYEFIPEDNWPFTGFIRARIAGSGFNEREEAVIRKVFDVYGDLKAFQLSALTHKDGTPWKKVFNEGRPSAVIPSDMIKDHFVELARTTER